MTYASLEKPIELLPDLSNGLVNAGKRATFAYLGPVEWNRMGTISYGLWVHIAPGNNRLPGDIHTPGAAVLNLDDGPLELKLIDAPKLGSEPYRDAVSWGQTAYFDLSVATLRRIAASSKLGLTVPGADGSPMAFNSTADARVPLGRYLEARGLNRD